MENLSFLACQNNCPVATAHIRDGVRHIDVNCDHARSFEPQGIKCQWRLLINNVVDFEKAGDTNRLLYGLLWVCLPLHAK